MRRLTLAEEAILSNSSSAVCFSGPRPGNLPDKGNKKSAAIIEIERKLSQQIKHYIAAGKTTFLNGGMSGFDIIAGETVLQLKQVYPQILCVTIAPFRINYFDNDNWTPAWKRRALDVFLHSDIAFSLSETYHKRVYFERNEYMVNHSSALLCYYAGHGWGTKYTLEYAVSKQLEICNIALNSCIFL